MSNELNQLVNDNPVPLLKFFGDSNPHALKEQVMRKEPGHETFFISLVKTSYSNTEAQKDLLALCNEYGYSLKTTTKSSNYWSNHGEVPDYIHLWAHVRDNFLSYASQSLESDYILEMDKKYRLLKKAYEKNYPQTIKTLEAMGVAKNYEDGKLLAVASQKPETLRLYWETRDSPHEKFESIKSYLKSELARFSSSSASESYRVDGLKDYLKEELPRLTQEQKEDVHALAATCINQKIYSHLTTYLEKDKKKNPEKYGEQKVPIWKYAHEGKSHRLWHNMADAKIPLTTHSEHEGKSLGYLSQMVLLLRKIGYEGQAKTYKQGNEGSKITGIQEKMAQLMDQDFWLTANSKDNGHPWFHTACKDKSIFQLFDDNWLNLAPESMNFYNRDKKSYSLAVYEKIENTKGIYWGEGRDREIIKDLLSKTWLYQDETDKYSIESAMEICPNILYNPLYRLADFIKLDKNDLFPFKIKESMLYHLIKSSNPCSLFDTLIANLQGEEKMDWQAALSYTQSLETKSYKKSQITNILEPLVLKEKLERGLEEKENIKSHKI